ncbi:GNAT family N-acetyltransferase [Photobacterium proteolyticum]|uniref:GNAT family N-acetyltransferase n=1 Tax=Photobacterium proteolyticum TaxID=1903952 RepID=A0A1Q9G6S4_9GAMM|nr:GNAT family N-acetyltransferase [Photobacterium proteolyticum]OLQ69994.1 GNAT family N-acetyltransferase [Photobacterium proteolyticum]
MEVDYKVNHPITSEEFIELLNRTSLGERRPLESEVIVKAMLDNASLMVTAWLDGKLVGLARSLTDYHYCCYLSDLAVDESVQSMGIGKYLIKKTKEALKPECKIVLLAAPLAEEYYPKIGFDACKSAWVLSDIIKLVI